jgi:alkylhydroperoxidase family enzyme
MSFLHEPLPSEAQQRMYDEDLEADGYVGDNTRAWAHQPGLTDGFGDLLDAASEAAGLSLRDKAMLVIGQSVTLGDSYCSFAWGNRLTEIADADTAIAALGRDDSRFSAREQALAQWARTLAADPNGTTPADVERLRQLGFDEAQIVAMTLYTSLRIAMSVTNDALGAHPDLALADQLDPAVRAGITWGRPPA